MNKTDTRIKKTRHLVVKEKEPEKPVSVKTAPAQGPCDECGNPIVPNKPTPNVSRPKRKTEKEEELIYTNGVQRNDNVISVKVHPDSTGYLRTSKNGLSAKFLINKLECLLKSMKKLNDGITQLKEEVQPAVIGEKIVEIDKEFEMNDDGTMQLKLGDGLKRTPNGYIQLNLDTDTLAFDENGKLMTIWSEFSPEENE